MAATTGRITSFQRDGLTFDVIDTGPLDGPVAVLLHGFPSRATCWHAVAMSLNAAGVRTLAPDQRGYSPGARPRPIRAYRTRELVADVTALIDAVGGPVHLVGHDWGAAVAWATAFGHPDKIASLTAVSVGHPSAFMRSFVTSSQAARSYYMNLFSIPRVAERLCSGAWGERFLKKGGMSDSQYADYRRAIIDYGALTGGLNWYRALPMSLTEPRKPVEVPTSFVWSDNDLALGRKQAELTARFVRGPYEFVEMAGASHWIVEERPDELAEIVLRRIHSR